MGNRHSQSYSLSEGSQQLPKGDIQPSAAVQPLGHPSGSGQPEAQQPRFFMCLFVISTSSLEKCLFTVFCPFLDWIICFLGVEFDKFFIDLGY
uniref:Uncharacterized protein n=1 Tax=Ursus americanus TaxID=9643 RepID=A0A452S7G9_URSAM